MYTSLPVMARFSSAMKLVSRDSLSAFASRWAFRFVQYERFSTVKSVRLFW